MEVELDADTARLYSRIFVAVNDLGAASFSLGMLMKKGWHTPPLMRRGTVMQQQEAYTTAFVIAYARPFTRSIGWPALPGELVPYDASERDMHDHVMTLRHRAIAHSDSGMHSVRPWRSGGLSATIIGAPYPTFSAAEATRLENMIGKLTASLNAKLQELVP